MSSDKKETTLETFSPSAVKDMINDRSLIKHRRVLEQIYKFVIQALENDDKWAVKCQALKSEISGNKRKINAALSLSETDKNTIDTLKSQLKKAWSEKNELKKQNEESAETLSSEKDKTLNCDAKIVELTKKNQDLIRDLKRHQSELRLAKASNKSSEDIAQKSTLRKEIDSLKSTITNKEKCIKSLEVKLKKAEEKRKLRDGEKNEYDEALKQIEEYKLKNYELHEQLVVRDNDREEMMKEKKSKLEMIGKLEDEFKDVKNMFEPLLERVEKKSDLLSALKSEVSSIRNKLDEGFSMENASKASEVDCKSMAKQLEEITERDRRSKDCLAKVMRETKVLHEQIRRYQSMEKNFKTDLDEKVSENEFLRRSCDKYKLEVEKLVTLVKNLEKVGFRQASEIGNLEVKVQSLEKEILDGVRSLKAEESLRQELSQTRSELEIEKKLAMKFKFDHEIVLKEMSAFKCTVAKDVENLNSLLEEVLISKTAIMRLSNSDSDVSSKGHVAALKLANTNLEKSIELLRDELRNICNLTKAILDEKKILSVELNFVKSNEELLNQKLESMVQCEKDQANEISLLEQIVLMEQEKNLNSNETGDGRRPLEFKEVESFNLPGKSRSVNNSDVSVYHLECSEEKDASKLNLPNSEIDATQKSSIYKSAKSCSSQDFSMISCISDDEKETLQKHIKAHKSMLESKTDEIIKQSVLLNRKDQEIENLKKNITNLEKNERVVKYKNELSKKNKVVKELEEKAKKYEQCIRNHQMEEIRLSKELQRVTTKPERLPLPNIKKAWPAASKRLFMTSKFK